MAYKVGDKEASKKEEKHRQMSWKAPPSQDKKISLKRNKMMTRRTRKTKKLSLLHVKD